MNEKGLGKNIYKMYKKEKNEDQEEDVAKKIEEINQANLKATQELDEENYNKILNNINKRVEDFNDVPDYEDKTEKNENEVVAENSTNTIESTESTETVMDIINGIETEENEEEIGDEDDFLNKINTGFGDFDNVSDQDLENETETEIENIKFIEPIRDTAESIPAGSEVIKENNPAEQNNPEVVVSSPETAPATGENQAETPMTEEDIKRRLDELDGLFNELTAELQAGDESSKKGFFKKFFTFFKKEQARDESDVEKISRKEGQELIQIKNKIENHKSKYENNLGLVKDILSEKDKVMIEQNKKDQDVILLKEQEDRQDALDIRKKDLWDKYNSRKTSIEKCLSGYNEINNQTSKTRMEIAIQVLQAERAVRNLSNDKQATETLEVLRITIVEKLSKLKEQQLEIDHRYKLVRQRIVKLQTDYFEAKNMLNKINNLGQTTHEIADEIRRNRKEAEKIREEKEAKKKEEEEAEKKAAAAAAAAAKENKDNQVKEGDKKESEVKDDQVTTGNKQEDQKEQTENQGKQPDSQSESQEKQEEGIDIKVLDEYLKDSKMYLSNWNSLIVGSKDTSIYKDFYNFVKSLKNKGFILNQDKIDGLKVKQLMIDFLKKEKMREGAAKETVNNRLDKIRQLDL